MVVAVGFRIISLAALELAAALELETTLALDAILLDELDSDELLDELTTDELAADELEATELDAAELELVAAPQLAARLVVVLTTVLLTPLITTRVQPLAGTSAPGKPSPQPPLGSTLKRGPPPPSPATKLRQILKLVVEPATWLNKSPSAQPLWVPRKWNGVVIADELLLAATDDELATLLELLACADELATAPQFALKLVVVLTMVRELPLITTLVQPAAATSAAGNASDPQAP